MRVIPFAAILAALPLLVDGISTAQEASSAKADASAPIKPSAPTVVIPFKNKGVVFTMALGTDPATSGKLAADLAYWLRFKDKVTSPERQPQIINNSWVVPEPTWSLSDLIEHCRRDANVKGAFIVQPPGIANGTDSHFVYRRSWTNIVLTVVVAECDHSVAQPESSAHPAVSAPVASTTPSPPTSRAVALQAATKVRVTGAQTEVHIQIDSVPGASKKAPTPPPVAYIWASEPTVAEGQYKTDTVLFPLSALATLYTAFAPSRTSTTVRTTNFPTTPLPATGALASIATTNTTVTNNGSSGGAGSTLVTAFLTYTNTVAAIPNGDAQTESAVYNALFYVIEHMKSGECKPILDEAAKQSFCAW